MTGIRRKIASVVLMAAVLLGFAGTASANNRNLYAYPRIPFTYTVRCGNGPGQGTLNFRNGGSWADAYCNSYVSGSDWFDTLTAQLYSGSRFTVVPQGRRICSNGFTGQGQWTGKIYVC